MLQEYRELVDKMPELFAELVRCEPIASHPRSNFPKRPGVYAFYDALQPIYVGRAKNIWQRIGNHTGGRPEQSSLHSNLPGN